MSQLLRALKTADDKRKASRGIQTANSIDANQFLDHDDKESAQTVQEGNAKECELAPISPQISHVNDAHPQQTELATLKNRQWPLYSLITLGLLLATFALWSRVQTSDTTSRAKSDPALASIANAKNDANLEALPVTQLRLDKNFEGLHHDKSTEKK
ncbi:MAG: hypothetical protein HY253_07320 [Burkholderiales bacterium]|nr:hypothetical protein [Burkholderiales bacterium]